MHHSKSDGKAHVKKSAKFVEMPELEIKMSWSKER
jgi:hypothetical protein